VLPYCLPRLDHYLLILWMQLVIPPA